MAIIKLLGGDYMKHDFLGIAVFGSVLLIGLAVIITFVILGIFLVKALIR